MAAMGALVGSFYKICTYLACMETHLHTKHELILCELGPFSLLNFTKQNFRLFLFCPFINF